MNGPMITAQLPFRSLIIVLVAVVVLTALAGHLYVLKHPLVELESLRDSVFETRRSRPVDGPTADRIVALENEIAALTQRLGGNSPRLGPHEMVAFVIGQLDVIARARAVQLVSVEPGAIARVYEFEEIPFHIEVVGNYFHLVDWLHDAEAQLGPMVIKSFEIMPDANAAARRMHLTMVSYRAREQDA